MAILSRTVLVTGSSRGLGAVTAKTLAKQGFNVIVNYYKSKEKAERLVWEIGREKAVAIQANVLNRQEVNALVENATEQFGISEVDVDNAIIDFELDPDVQ